MTATNGVGTVHLTVSQLHQMAQHCESTGESLARGMARLVQNIEAISGTGFAGAANTALQNNSQELNRGMTTILNALNSLGEKIRATSDQTSIGDVDAASEISKAAAGTGNTNVVAILGGH